MAVALGIFVLIVADLPGLSSTVWAPKMAVLMVLGAAGLPILALRSTSGRKPITVPPALAAIVFVAIAAASAANSDAVVSAIVGLYNQGTGLVFVAALAGVWALGTLVDDGGRPLVEQAIVAGAVVNAVVAAAQQTVGLSSSVPAFGTHASGLLGNPVFLGAVCVAALALLGGRFAEDPRQWTVAVVVVGLGVGASAQRLPALLMLGVLVAEGSVAVWRRHRAGRPPLLGRLAWFSGLTLAGWLAGSSLYPLAHGRGLSASFSGGGPGAIGYTAQSTAQSTFGDRLGIWRVALTAIGHRPLLGYGPGQFRDATSGLVSPSLARSLGQSIFADAHNLFVEYATTTGLLGLVALVGWLALAARRRRGRLVLMSAVLLVISMAEPLNVVTTPLLFLGLGAARVGPRLGSSASRPSVRTVSGGAPTERERARERDGVPGGRGGRVAALVCAALAALVGLALVVGDVQYGRAAKLSAVGSQTAAINTATAADRELFAWPDVPSLMARAELIRNFGVTPAAGAQAATYAAEAVRRDPTDADLWGQLAGAQLDAGNLAAAQQSARRGVRLRPSDTAILNTLGLIARSRKDSFQAHVWFGRSLALVPDQTVIRALYEQGCIPSSVIGLFPPGERCG